MATFPYSGNLSRNWPISKAWLFPNGQHREVEGVAVDGHFWFLFPNIIFSIFPGTKNVSVSWVYPRGSLSEDTVRQFHRMYMRWMFPDAATV